MPLNGLLKGFERIDENFPLRPTLTQIWVLSLLGREIHVFQTQIVLSRNACAFEHGTELQLFL